MRGFLYCFNSGVWLENSFCPILVIWWMCVVGADWGGDRPWDPGDGDGLGSSRAMPTRCTCPASREWGSGPGQEEWGPRGVWMALAWAASAKAWLFGLGPHSYFSLCSFTPTERQPQRGGGRGERLTGSVLFDHISATNRKFAANGVCFARHASAVEAEGPGRAVPRVLAAEEKAESGPNSPPSCVRGEDLGPYTGLLGS